MKAVLRLTLLGGYEARLASGASATVPLRKAQALLAYLAVVAAGGAPASRERVAALLWGDRSDEQARASLRQAMFMRRRAIGDHDGRVIVAEADRVHLDPARAHSDVADFERAVAEASPAPLAHAASLYRGELLDGFTLSEAAFEDWLALERTRLRNLALGALDRLAAHHAGSEPEHAIEILDRLVEIDPLQEQAHRALMRLHAQLGRRAAALRQYETCASVLRRHLDVAPEP